MRSFCRIQSCCLPLQRIPLSPVRTRARDIQTSTRSPKTFLAHRPQSRRPFCITNNIYEKSSFPKPQHSAVDPVSILVVVAVVATTSYLVQEYIYPIEPRSPANKSYIEEEEQALNIIDTDMATQIPAGRPGNLTPEQEQRLKEFWLATLDVFGLDTGSNGSTDDASSITAPSTSGSATPTTGDDGSKHKKKLSLFKSKKNKDAESAAAAPPDDVNDKHGQTKEFKEAIASTSPETLRQAFWSMVKHDDPDALLLRFLRARKWDVQNALIMLISTMHWRADDMHVDDDIMLRGEEYALKKKDSDKDSADFLSQLRMGKSVLHGVDKEGRPVVSVRVRLHKGGEQTEKSLERYTVYTIETARMMLRGNVDTATIIFDMTGFSMANMVRLPFSDSQTPPSPRVYSYLY